MANIVQSASLVCNDGTDAVFGSPTAGDSFLVALVGTRATQSGDIPGGWTQIGPTVEATSGGAGSTHSMRAFAKAADAGEDTYTIGNGAGSMGTVYEIAGLTDIDEIAVVSATEQAYADPQVIGAVAGDLLLMGLIVSLEGLSVSHEDPGTGWTEDNGAFTSNCDSAPRVFTAHGTGAISAEASIDGSPHGNKQFAGIALVVGGDDGGGIGDAEANAWDIFAADDLTGEPIATLVNAKERWLHDELHGLGEGGFTINRHAVEATEENLAEGNMVKVRIADCGPDYIFAMALNRRVRTVVHEGGRAAGPQRFAGQRARVVTSDGGGFDADFMIDTGAAISAIPWYYLDQIALAHEGRPLSWDDLDRAQSIRAVGGWIERRYLGGSTLLVQGVVVTTDVSVIAGTALILPVLGQDFLAKFSLVLEFWREPPEMLARPAPTA